MDPDRRHRILRTMTAVAEATPADIAGPAQLSIAEMATLARIESGVLGDLVHCAEIGTRVAGVLDRDLADRGGGWRYPTRAERSGDSAAHALALFRDSRSW